MCDLVDRSRISRLGSALLVSIVMAGVSAATVAAVRGAEPEVAAELAAITSTDETGRSGAIAGLLGRQDRLVTGMIAFLDSPGALGESREAAAAVMDVLGELRAGGAVDVLTSSIAFRRPGVGPNRLPQLSDYPAALALAKIGQPALPAIVSTLAAEDNPLSDWLGIEVLLRLDGWQIAALRLRLAADKEPEAKPKERLLSLAARLEQAYGRTAPTSPPAAAGE